MKSYHFVPIRSQWLCTYTLCLPQAHKINEAYLWEYLWVIHMTGIKICFQNICSPTNCVCVYVFIIFYIFFYDIEFWEYNNKLSDPRKQVWQVNPTVPPGFIAWVWLFEWPSTDLLVLLCETDTQLRGWAWVSKSETRKNTCVYVPGINILYL